MSNSNAVNPPPPPSPSLSSLPDEIVLRCLALVPRSYYLNISWVSKHLRALVRSPELNVMRSTFNKKKSLYVCFQEEEDDEDTFHWFTLCPTECQLVPNPTPFPCHPCLTVEVGSKIFFIGGYSKPTTDLWILDTRSGTMTQGTSMSEPRVVRRAAAGVIDGKIYVIGGGEFYEEVHVEVFDPKSETWEVPGVENVPDIPRYGASVEGKVYMVDYEKTHVYNPRENEGRRLIQMVSKRLKEGGREEMLRERVAGVCAVEDVLFALFDKSGLMWFDTKRNVWRRLVGREGKEMFIFHADVMAEYDGKLVVLYMWGESRDTFTKSVRCKLVSLHKAGDRICGTIDWSGVVASVPDWFDFLHCLAVSDIRPKEFRLRTKEQEVDPTCTE
ncbi:unnamed protein product [Eruca vesicaria subsp. sativa]|uniref:F-box domain-containing protein n=1 Tax=Eruca vesicaria subsp. sativa TaxID=29727 RepID=A0ABC8LKW6_ERUVS|nr:unnamed protein product [Eruca vesicaria subsp. sativa]